MRVVAQIVAALLVLLFVAAIGLYVVLPRLVGGEFVRVRLSDAMMSAIGRGIEFTTLEFELFPPSVIAIDAVIGDAAMPLATAERIQLTPALAPLLAGVLLIDRAIVEGAKIRLVRNRSGIAFADATPGERGRTAEANRAARSDLALRGLLLLRAEFTLEDRCVDPPLLWTLRDAEVSASAEALGSPVHLDFDGRLATGGRMVGNGEVAADAELELVATIEAVEIATARPYFTADSSVGGLLTGSIRVTGRVESPAIELTATLRAARLQLGDIALRGTLEVAAQIRDAVAAPNGLVELDATQAEVGYAGFFTKAPGTPARVIGQVTTGAGGSASIDTWEFVMQDLDGHARAGPAVDSARWTRGPNRADARGKAR